MNFQYSEPLALPAKHSRRCRPPARGSAACANRRVALAIVAFQCTSLAWLALAARTRPKTEAAVNTA